MIHLMLDTETLGLTPGHVVSQIGIVEFDPHNPMEFGREFKVWIDVDISIRNGFKVDGKTLMWWLSQPAVAQKRAFKVGRSDDVIAPWELAAKLNSFYTDLPEGRDTCIWAHGAAFDFGMVAALVNPQDIIPWNYRSLRDTRTLYDLIGGAPDALFRGVQHDALDDAKAQATQVQSAFLALRNLVPDLADMANRTPVQGTPLAAFCEAIGYIATT